MSQFVPPAGFHFHDRNSAFSDLAGPYYLKAEKGSPVCLAQLIEERHLNRVGVTHGGVLMTLADNAIGDAIINAYDQPVNSVTVSMASEFMSPARLGDWVVAETELHRRGRRLVFAECMVKVGERKIMRASAVMSLVMPEGVSA